MDRDRIDESVRQVRAGALDAFSALVEETQDRLRSHILWVCPCSAEAVDDIAQEVYVHAYRNLDQYELGTDFWAWLKALARFRAMSYLRRATARVQREQKYADAAMLETFLNEEPADEQSAFLAAMRRCMEHLSEEARLLLGQFYGEEVSSEALGGRIGKTRGAVRVILLRIRGQLRKCVERRMQGAEVEA